MKKVIFYGALIPLAGLALYVNVKPEVVYKEMGYQAVSDFNGDVILYKDSYEIPKIAGNYLASHHAQNTNDWVTANRYLNNVIDKDDANHTIIKKSMILAMGAGDLDLAASRAQQLLDYETENSLASLLLAIHALDSDQPDEAERFVLTMPLGDVTDFMTPLVHGWAKAAQGELSLEGFNDSVIHSYSAALIGLFLNKNDVAAKNADAVLRNGGNNSFDMERVADIYVAVDEEEKALELYNLILSQNPDNPGVRKKLNLIRDKADKQRLADHIYILNIDHVSKGVATALYDMSRILYQERSDSSARLFAQMALGLSPDYHEARLLLANALARTGRYDEAIANFSNIGPEHEDYVTIQHYIAELLAEAEREDEAMAVLNDLFLNYNDIEALIRIGDLHRSSDDYNLALDVYNKAAAEFGETVPEEYWYLLYARGMAHEREGDWNKAENDLKAALTYRPDHPYLLNYLGYGWAEQGLNLEESLSLIRRAVELRPTDGYISDSLGWVLYRMGRYDEAVPYLEKAVELLPYDPTINDHLGDAYWKVGRRLEARFQWQRAINNADEETDVDFVQTKLDNGLNDALIKEAMQEVVPAEASTQEE